VVSSEIAKGQFRCGAGLMAGLPLPRAREWRGDVQPTGLPPPYRLTKGGYLGGYEKGWA
jgi:hypothetical protein